MHSQFVSSNDLYLGLSVFVKLAYAFLLIVFVQVEIYAKSSEDCLPLIGMFVYFLVFFFCHNLVFFCIFTSAHNHKG